MKNKILLIGGTSIIGNAIAAEINYENDFIIIRTVRDKRLANKYSEFIDLSSTKNILESLQKIYSKHQINHTILSLGKMNFRNIDDQLSLIEINFKIQVAILIGIFKAKIPDSDFKFVYVSSALVNLRPRKKNLEYYSSKIAMDHFARGFFQNLDNKKNLTYIIVRPGYVISSINKFQKSNIISAKPVTISKIVVKKIRQSHSGVVYAPRIYKYIVLLINLLPNCIYNKLDNKSVQ